MPEGPNPVRIATTDNFLGNQDILKDERLRQLILQHPGEKDLLIDLLDVMGRSRPVERTIYSHDEKSWVTKSLGVAAPVGAPGIGNPITFKIPASEHDSSGTYVYARVDDVVEFSTTQQGVITAVVNNAPNDTDVTVEPKDATVSLPALVNTDRVVVISNVHAEQTGQPEGRTPNKIKIEHQLQIIKENYTVSGTAWAAGMTWTTHSDGKGGTKDSWTYEGMAEFYQRFERQMSMSCINEDPTNNNPALTNLRFMTGLIPFIIGGGNEVNYTPTTFGLSDMDDMIDLLDAEKSGKREYWLLTGLPLSRQFDDFISQLGAGGGIVYGSFAGNKELAISLMFNSFSRTNYTFHKKTIGEFTNPEGLGAPGFPYENYGLVVPTGKVSTASAGQAYMLEKTYAATRGYSRQYEFFINGSAGPASGVRADSDIDEVKFQLRTECGTWFKNDSHFGIFRP